jgi:hypothetical protein
MSLDGAITNLASWAGNTMMPTMAGLFFAGAVYRYSKGGPFEQFLYGGLSPRCVQSFNDPVYAADIDVMESERTIHQILGQFGFG